MVDEDETEGCMGAVFVMELLAEFGGTGGRSCPTSFTGEAFTDGGLDCVLKSHTAMFS